MFDLEHLQGTSRELVQPMFQIGRKAAELKRTKLQMEIQKEQSERRRRQLEQRIEMASKNPGKGSQVKNPKPQKKDEENPEDLETLMEEMDKPNCKTVSYTCLSTGQWLTKGTDRQA